MAFLDRWPPKRGSIDMKSSMIGQEKGGLLIEVATWAGLTLTCLLQSGKSQTKNRFKKTLTSPKIVPSKALGLKLQKATQEAEKLVKMTEQERLIRCIYRDVTDKEGIQFLI